MSRELPPGSWCFYTTSILCWQYEQVANLARAGVPLVTAQRLARHSSPVLTAQIYSIMDMGDLSEAVGKLGKPK